MQAVHEISSKLQKDDPITLAVSASFTAEPIEEALSFWMDKLAISATIEFAPYNQIFQQLLDPSSLLSANQQGINVILLRVEDWCRFNQAAHESGDLSSILKRNAQDFVSALKAAVSHASTPYILCLCPAAVTPLDEVEEKTLFQQIEAEIITELTGLKGLHVIQAQEVLTLYHVEEYYDLQRDQLGHIPFTSEFFTALGTAIARKIYAIKSSPHKVIVLDCDNTLWRGVVGEDGVFGIDVSQRWQAVQEFMRAQQQAGMLLCLCSKNNEADVMPVFEQRSDMPLRLEHLVAWRINWLPKSENIKSLAAELNLGLDSFIFVDDNPVECAEVSTHCPEVLTLQLPIDGDMKQFLNHVWAFDHLQVTAEDAQRTVLYQQNVERQRLQQQALTMQDFLADLEMVIDIAEPSPDQIARVAQLTQRTNQFNCTTRRRAEAEIQQLMQSGVECRAVTVRDRFGDYGLVGMMLFSTDATDLHVDTFLLSCRVLGRGVEHHMVRYLAQFAAERALKQINLSYVPTAKNRPALNFLETVAGKYQQSTDDGDCFWLPVEQAAVVSYTASTPQATAVTSSSAQAVPKPKPAKTPIGKSQQLGRIATDLQTPREILLAIQSQRRSAKPSATPLSGGKQVIAPRTATESDLRALWAELLNMDAISVTDNYFELGGTSLQAVALFAQIEQYFGKRFPLTCLLEAPTLEALAKLIDSGAGDAPQVGKPNSVLALNNTQGVTLPLFLIHPGNGDVLLYRNLAQRLQPSTAVYAIKPYSRDGYPIVHTQIPEMAAYYIEQIRTIQPEGPYFLGGFCAGGVIAFEMALQLQQQGIEVPCLTLMNSIEMEERKAWVRAHQTNGRLKLLWWGLKTKIKMALYKYCAAKLKHPPQFAQGMSVLSVMWPPPIPINPKHNSKANS
jgi:FkbH-like protein